MRYVLTAASAALLTALFLALVANPHALPPPTKKPWSSWSLGAKEDYVRSNLHHARFAVAWIKGHRHLYGRQLSAADRLIVQHRRLIRKASRNLAAIEARLHPPFVFPDWFMRLVDCESGDGTGTPPYTPWWGYNLDFEGGPNFVHSTWTDYGGRAYAEHAYDATPYQQYVITLRVLNDVGPGAWPVCSYKAGMR